MAQDYLVKDFQVGDYKDNHNNTWCTVSLEGIGEPVRIVLKDPTSVTLGATIYGHIEEKTSQAGKQYLRFYRDQREDSPGSAVGNSDSPVGKSGAYRRDDASTQESIARSVALKAAVDFATDTKMDLNEVIDTADLFLTWLQSGELNMSNNPSEAEKPNVAQSEPTPDKPVGRNWSKLGQGKGREQPDEQWGEPDVVDLNSIFPPED